MTSKGKEPEGVVRKEERGHVMKQYLEHIPQVVEFMGDHKRFNNDIVVIEAWYTLIYRAILWHWSVELLTTPRGTMIPSSLYWSKIPVYIA